MEQKDRMTFHEFWPYYVKAHNKRGTRFLHGAGSIAAIVFVVMAIVLNPWYLLLAPLVGYGLAWYGHFFVEGNRPATFGHPFYSLAADYRMLLLGLLGRMDAEVARHRTDRGEEK
ncbi:MAG: DUF962 domain-containing protein [Acidobacteria bacterium]|nr:DUF962 domain-containing protein [Acidobacteriota bacterium]